MQPHVDWKGVMREIRLLATQLQPARFFAIYLLLLLIVVAYLLEFLGRAP
ncbi:MAG TPA: hypothetical protein PK306_25810 [Aquabacterium sp.]|nr:hypothetical protein [Aquabacterium sp.]